MIIQEHFQAALLWELVGSGWWGGGWGWGWPGGSTRCARPTTSLGSSTNKFAHCTKVYHHHNRHTAIKLTHCNALFRRGFGDYIWKVFWGNFYICIHSSHLGVRKPPIVLNSNTASDISFNLDSQNFNKTDHFCFFRPLASILTILHASLAALLPSHNVPEEQVTF